MSETPAMVGNAADEEQVRSALSRAKRARLRELDDVRAVLATDSGRRFFGRMLAETGAMPLRSVFRGEAIAQTNYEAGRQDVGNWILGELAEAKPAAVIDVLTSLLKETE